MKYFDISPIISSRIAVFPGDMAFSRPLVMSFEKGHHLELSTIQTTVHVGAHADASIHYHADGEGIDKKDLSIYMGKCQVIHVPIKRGERILPSHVQNVSIQAPRVLFATNSFPDPDQWNHDFCSLSPELVHELAKKGVFLVGIDTPSIDPEESKALESHQAVFQTKMSVLEGLLLEHVPDGIYNLIALPLRIEGADASPVRAILTEI